jgi:glycosyltransferase involved in cell wall biosynthesis
MKTSARPKLLRISTVALSLNLLLKGQLAFLNKHFNLIAVSGNGKDLNEVERREQVTTISVEFQRNISPFKDFISLWQLYWLFNKEKPLIVHSITPKAGLISMTAAYFARVPIRMHTFTGLIFPTRTGLMKKILVVMDKLLCHFATNVYPEGQGVRNDLINFKITAKPLIILANGNVNGIDTSYFSSENFTEQQNQDLKYSLGIKPDDFVFIFVGRLVGDKGINELVGAFENFEFQNSKLLLVGPLEINLDPLHDKTLQEIKNNPNIISVGFQKDVRPYFAISNCLAFPSYREGFPNVVMQAGSMGLPSIVTNINGCNEIIMDGQNGIIIPVRDTESLSKAMSKIISNVNFYKQLQLLARSMIVLRYEQDLVWEAILAEYKKLESEYYSRKQN